MTDPLLPDPETLSPVQRRAHQEVHAAVTAFLGGDDVNARAILALSDAPHAVAVAAVTELYSAVLTIAHVTGADPGDTWREVCALWHTKIDT